MILKSGTAGVFIALLGGVALAQPAKRNDGPVYLAYAGAYSASPSSAFGHLFLILADSADEPLPLRDVITFTAVTFDADPFRYLTVGMLGGFLGKYSRQEFHRTSREYQLLDDRDLWLVELRLSPSHRRALDVALDRTTGRWYPYTFLSRNCAYYLQALLAEATGIVDVPSGVVSPTGVMSAVLRTPLAGRSFTRPSASKRITALAATASPATIDRLQDSWRDAVADTAWVATLTPSDRHLVQEVVQLRSSETLVALEPATNDGLGKLRVLRAARSTEPPTPSAGPGREISAPRFHRYTRLRAGYVSTKSAPTRIALQIRGSMHDEFDPWIAHEPISTMEFLSLELSSPSDEFAPRVESAVLFSQRALVPSTWVKPRIGWMGELQMRRGDLMAAGRAQGELRIGVGQAWRLFGNTWAHGFATAAAIATSSDGAALAPGAEAGVTGLPSDRFRFGVRWSEEHDIASWDRVDRRARGWARLDISSRVGMNMVAERIFGTSRYTLALDWYR